MLGLYMQHLSTRHQHLEARAGSQQVYNLYTSINYLLKVVQQKQHLSLTQNVLQTFQKEWVSPFLNAECLSNSGHNQCGIANRSQVHEKDTIDEEITQLCRYLQT